MRPRRRTSNFVRPARRARRGSRYATSGRRSRAVSRLRTSWRPGLWNPLCHTARERMDTTRQTTVLFADVSGSTKLYEAAGDAKALEAISHCIERLRRSSEAFGGRVVKTIGDEVMVLFPSPDAAAGASADMQHAIDAMPMVESTKLGVRIGFQYGPVMQRDDDVFGDTVNLAARLVGQAGKGQIITSSETLEMLGP